MEPRPKILILGNGFDLAHYLPTSYTHFIKAMMVIEESELDRAISFDELFADYFKNKDKRIQKTQELYKTDELILSAQVANELRTKLKGNGWFQHFKDYLTKIDTWIDFETEIENVLKNCTEVFSYSFEENTIQVCPLEGVLGDKEKIFNHNFFNQYQIKKEKLLNLFSDFSIFREVYVIDQSWANDSEHRYSTVSLEDFDSVDESRRHNGFDVTIIKKHSFPFVILDKYLERFSENFLGFNIGEVFNKLINDLEIFTEIFETYISELINKLEPKKPFEYKGDVLGHSIEAVFTFNYSNSFERFYPNCELKLFDYVQYLHGNADDKNTVLGISDLEDERLKKHKVYSFVKTYQKLIKKTDYDFLKDTELFDRKEQLANGKKLGMSYEIIIWGHSLDSSDAEYIKEIFKLNNERGPTNIQITVWYHDKPHNLLANLMHIMGKDIIQEWMKRRWLRFERSLTVA